MSTPAQDIITAVILAAGAGSRLGELGKRYSKPMVPVCGRPLIDWVIERLEKAGVGRVVVVGHPSDAQLRRSLATRHPGAVLVQQPERRGIADALSRALPLLADDEGYLACACDSLFPVDDLRRIIALGRHSQAAACVGVLEMGHDATVTRSAVRVDADRVVEIVEKPAPGTAPSGLVALPLYWLPREFHPCLQNVDPASGELFISNALTDFARRGGCVYPAAVSERIEVTTVADVDALAKRLRLEQSN